MAMVRPPGVRPQHLMAGSGESAEASSQEIIMSITNLFNQYAQVEPNKKVLQETEQKYQILRDRLQEGQISP